MVDYRKRIESQFEQFAQVIYRRKWWVLPIMLLFIAAILSQLPSLKIDTSTEGFLHDDDPALLAYNEFRQQFGRDDVVVLAVKPPQVFDLRFLVKLKLLHEELEDKVPYVDEVTSLINARNTRGEADKLIVEDLLENLPQNKQELKTLEQQALAKPLYRNLLLSENGHVTTIIVRTNAFAGTTASDDVLSGFDTGFEEEAAAEDTPQQFLTDEQNSEVVQAIQFIVDNYSAKDFPISVAGSPVLVDSLKRSMQKDMRKFTVLAIGIIALILLLIFRRVSGVFIPLIVVILSLLSTLGLMAFFGVAIKLPTQILPSFLLAVGVAACVHLLALFYREFDFNENSNKTKEKAVVQAMGHSGLAITMASLTTAAGLFSFSAAEVAPIADLGRFAGLGVLICLVYTIVLTPVLLGVLPIRQKKPEKAQRRHETMDKILFSVAGFTTRNAKCILIASVLIIATTLIAVSQIRFYHNPLLWLPDSMQVRAATIMIDREMRGSNSVEVVIDTGKENGLYEPKLMQAIDALHAEVNNIQDGALFVGKSVSVADILKETNQALNENKSAYYKIPDDRQLIAQELLLFENSGSDDLEDFVDSQFSKARFTIKLPWLDAHSNAEFLTDIEQRFNKALEGQAEVTATGVVSLLARALSAAIESTKQSYLIAAIIITLMMIALLGDIKLGLVAMVPNLLPILITLGVMAYSNIPLDMFTMLIGSIAIGLAVDDTIHFMHNFRRYYNQTGNVETAVQQTFHTAGRAIVVTSIVLSAGFFIFMASGMNNLANFGKLCGLTIIIALLADLILAPAIVAFMYKNKQQSQKTQSLNQGSTS
jgi:predicted RND superfamily exporter protein